MRNRFPRNCRIQLGSLENVVLLTGDRKFESISLQRGVSCEPDFRGRIPSITVGDSSALTKRRLKRMACTDVSSGTAY